MPSYTRRALKEDKFAETAQGAMHWATDHRRNVLWGAGAIVIAGLAAAGWFFWNGYRTEQANMALSKAMRTFTAPLRPAGTPANAAMPSFTSMAERGTEAEKQFKEVAAKFSFTSPGRIAGYMAGAAALQAGNNAAAEPELKDAASSGDKNVAALAKLALATLYRNTNRQPDAAKIYKDLSDHPTETVPKAEAQLDLADMYESTDPKEATVLYQQIQKDNSESPAGQIAASKLAGTKQ